MSCCKSHSSKILKEFNTEMKRVRIGTIRIMMINISHVRFNCTLVEQLDIQIEYFKNPLS